MAGGCTGFSNLFKGKSAQIESKTKELTARSKAALTGKPADRQAAELAKFQHQVVKGGASARKTVDGYVSSASSSISKGYNSAKSSITGEKPPATFGEKAKAWGEKAWGGNKIYENHATKWLDKTFSSNKAQ